MRGLKQVPRHAARGTDQRTCLAQRRAQQPGMAGDTRRVHPEAGFQGRTQPLFQGCKVPAKDYRGNVIQAHGRGHRNAQGFSGLGHRAYSGFGSDFQRLE